MEFSAKLCTISPRTVAIKKTLAEASVFERGECITRRKRSQSPRPPQSNEQCSSP